MAANTTFTAGEVLTATAANAWPRGLMAAVVESSTTDTFTTTEKIMLSFTFAAVANRKYVLTYIEPNLTGTAASVATTRFHETSLAGSILQTLRTAVSITLNATTNATFMYTAAASGSLVIVASAQASTGTVTATRSSTQLAQLYVTDIGTA